MALGTSSGEDRTVMLVSSDQKFVEGASRFLNGHKVHTARNVTDAQRRMVEDHVDLAVLDASYATESGVIDGGQLLQVDPDLPIVLVASTLDMSVLRVALRIGYKDVVDAPVDRPKMEAMLGLIEDQAQREILTRGHRSDRWRCQRCLAVGDVGRPGPRRGCRCRSAVW